LQNKFFIVKRGSLDYSNVFDRFFSELFRLFREPKLWHHPFIFKSVFAHQTKWLSLNTNRTRRYLVVFSLSLCYPELLWDLPVPCCQNSYPKAESCITVGFFFELPYWPKNIFSMTDGDRILMK